MAVYVEIGRCIGCRSCEVACQREHAGYGHISLQKMDHASVPVLCHHCEEPLCAAVCFTGALQKDGNRTSLDVAKCTGCGLCQLACPFGAIRSERIAYKCDLCHEREVPVCVQTCPAEALSIDPMPAAVRARMRAARGLSRGGGH
ncbi:MAG: 4Fe-4S binding protein [Methanothrix sp.]|nr:4Fe-4S binding protein [Methanothrix sp.]